jgi:capsular polysaccharide biosynthesis protein
VQTLVRDMAGWVAGLKPRQKGLVVTLRDAVYILRMRWLTVVVVIVAVTIIAVVWSWLAQPTYMASTRILIATPSATDGQDAFAAAQLATARIVSYNELIMSESLATRTVKRRNLHIAPRDLAKKVDASAKTGSLLITLSVTDPSATNAVSLANALSDDFVSMVQELETTPADIGPPVVRAVIVAPAVDQQLVSPHRSTIILFGVIIGLLLGPVVAILLGRPKGRDRGEDKVKPAPNGLAKARRRQDDAPVSIELQRGTAGDSRTSGRKV